MEGGRDAAFFLFGWRRSLRLLYGGGLSALYNGAPLVLYGVLPIEQTLFATP